MDIVELGKKSLSLVTVSVKHQKNDYIIIINYG